MINFIMNLNPVLQALIATTFTWLITLLGASLVFFFKRINKNILDSMLSFSAGIMMSASYFSLISPALELSIKLNMCSYIVISFGFILGGLFLFLGDFIYGKITINKNEKKRVILLILSITLHNIPEGLAVGVAFGSIAHHLDGATFVTASLLALGIGLQNFPEGCAVSIPLRRDGMSRKKAFFWGQLSGFVEPIAGVVGALLATKIRLILPYLLSFAAGAMIYVVVEELIPESQSNKNKDLMTFSCIIGFVVMMILDIALN